MADRGAGRGFCTGGDFSLDTFAAFVHNLRMATKQQTITIRVSAKLYKEISDLAAGQRRTMSNMGEYLLILGKLKLYEQDLETSRKGTAK